MYHIVLEKEIYAVCISTNLYEDTGVGYSNKQNVIDGPVLYVDMTSE